MEETTRRESKKSVGVTAGAAVGKTIARRSARARSFSSTRGEHYTGTLIRLVSPSSGSEKTLGRRRKAHTPAEELEDSDDVVHVRADLCPGVREPVEGVVDLRRQGLV